ncbi:MAG TPA: iron-containing alcohol dehydrogenase [Gaiellaceae bacterium]|jgi:maleylacetate reductase|nr:iron-containing alcohol dehydrogenase [Gaiellaceae bacterium]
MIVRWGIEELGGLLADLGSARPLLVTTARFADLELPVATRFAGVQRHSPLEVVSAAIAAAAGSDGLVGVGGGSAIDTSKAVSSATGLPLVAIPTTYSGAEWTPYFGMRDSVRRLKTGGSGANTGGVVYEPALTLGLPREETVGTAMNALAHCAEALYAGPCEHASLGAERIARWLPAVVSDGGALEARTGLLEGAMYGGMALAERGLFLAHAMAQALGGRYGISHGAMNAICLAPALRFNEPAVPEAVAALGQALGTDRPVERVEEFAGLGGYVRLRDFGVPENELPELAREIADRPGARANPRHATAEEVEPLLRAVW